MAPTPVCDPNHIALLPCLTVLHRHSTLWSPPLGPLGPFPCSQHQILLWGCSPISMLQFLAASLSGGLASLYRVYMAVGRIVCMILISFRLSRNNYFTLQQPQMLHLCSKQLPWCGDLTPASVSPLPRCRSSPNYSPLFCPPSFVLPSFARFYIFFSCGQVLLPNLSWYYARSSVFESVLLMYPWPPTAPPSWISSHLEYYRILNRLLCAV